MGLTHLRTSPKPLFIEIPVRTGAVADLAHRLIDDTAFVCSINSLTGYLKSLGHKVPKSAVSDCVQWFEDAYFLFTVRIFDRSAAR